MILCPVGHANPDGRTYCKDCTRYIDSSEEVQTALLAAIKVPLPPTVSLDPPRVVFTEEAVEASVAVGVSNPNTAADEYRIDVTGQPAAWSAVEPVTLAVPAGAEGSARVVLRPPAAALAQPGTVSFGVEVTPASGGPPVSVTGSLEVVGYSRLSARLDPDTAESRTATEHTLSLANEGTVAVAATLQGTPVHASGASGRVTVGVTPTTVSVPPAGTATARVVVRPDRRRVLGGDVSHRFRVVASGGPAPVTVDGVMIQKSNPRLVLALLFVPLLVLVAVTVAALDGDDDDDPVKAKLTYAQEVLADGPIRYFRLDDAGNSAKDSSPSGQNGAYVGAPLRGVPGALPDNSAVNFDGSDDFVNLGVGVNVIGDFTLEAWVRLSPAISNADAIVGQLGVGQDANFAGARFRLYSGTMDFIVATTTVAAGGDFKHFVATRTGTTLRLFINGQLNTTQVQGAGPASFGTFRPKAIGRGNAGFFAGQLDEVAIYAKALGAERVKAHFEASGRTS